jgi:lipid-A-disaccharide synthase
VNVPRRPRPWTDRLPVAVVVTFVLLREVLRVAAVPLHAIGYLLRRGHHRAGALAALRRTPDPSADPIGTFLRRHRHTPPADAPTREPHVFVSCGEASGERHADGFLTAARDAGLRARITGFGGPVVARHGSLAFPLAEHAVIGFGAVVVALPRILRAFATFARLLRTDPPDLIVLVDYPGLHMVMGRYARRRGIPVVHYVAPQHWAWAPWRMKRYARCVDLTLTLFPFEVPLLQAGGVLAAYVGHPLLEPRGAQPPPLRDATIGGPDRPATLLLMPGSRGGEIATHLPPFLRIARAMRAEDPSLRIAVAQTETRHRERIERILADADAGFATLQIGPLSNQLDAADVVLVKSGTGSLEVALRLVPNVVAYSIQSWLVRWMARHFLTVPFFAAANLVSGRVVVPEIGVRVDSEWARVEAAVRRLLRDPESRAALHRELVTIRSALGEPGADRRVAAVLLAFCNPTERP